MKILHIIPSISSLRGGPSQAVLEMVRSLRENSIDAEILTTNDNGSGLLDVPLGKPVEYQNVPVYFLPRFSPPIHPIREFAFSGEFTSWLWKNIHNYHLVHIHAIFSYPSTIAMAIARCKNVPYIIRPLGQLCEWSLKQSALRKNIYLNLIEKTNLNQAQYLHLTSELEQQELSHLQLKTPSFILPHGLKIPTTIPEARQKLRKQLNLPADEPIILFLSRLHPKKGLDYLIPALEKLTQHRFTFVIAGSGDAHYEAEIKTLLETHKISDRTHMVGFVKGEKKNLLMQGADIFTLTSYSENFGVAVLEALASGLPVVVTPEVALSSLVAKHQLGYVVSQEILNISTTVEKLLSNPQEAKKMGLLASELISKQYSWNNIAKNLNEVYEKITYQKE
ncbi:MAG: glycosyltransferase [Cyanobacteria bacterium P01_A01_bin.84]